MQREWDIAQYYSCLSFFLKRSFLIESDDEIREEFMRENIIIWKTCNKYKREKLKIICRNAVTIYGPSTVVFSKTTNIDTE